MKKHHLHCQDPWFSFIRNGQKIVEGRKNLTKFKKWRPGDHLIFQCNNEEFSTRIVALRCYKSLSDYLDSEGFQRVLPGVRSLDEAMSIYLQWSTEEEIAKYGFLAIEVELLSS